MTFEQLDAEFDSFVQQLRAYHPHCYSVSFEPPQKKDALAQIRILSRLPDLKKPSEYEYFTTVITIERDYSCWGGSTKYDDVCETWLRQTLRKLCKD